MNCQECKINNCIMKNIENADALKCLYCEYGAEPVAICCVSCIKDYKCEFVERGL